MNQAIWCGRLAIISTMNLLETADIRSKISYTLQMRMVPSHLLRCPTSNLTIKWEAACIPGLKCSAMIQHFVNLVHNLLCGEGSDVESSAYISDIAVAKYAFACGLFIWKNIKEDNAIRACDFIASTLVLFSQIFRLKHLP